MLFLIVGLGAVERHNRHRTDDPGFLVVTLGKGGVVELGSPARKRPKSLPAVRDHIV
ncbi:hypothetical protein SDC9_116345 [bioreactor metagenome]|uniref:Uncharacterized protein n=1 Tax=bioreactor metagenome TaxID=1076179 RepID=A0A645BVC0_9ZZZZ